MPNRVNLSFRMLEDMHAELTAWAQQEDRSLHNLIGWILKQALIAHKEGEKK
jgi:hypothetical protein